MGKPVAVVLFALAMCWIRIGMLFANAKLTGNLKIVSSSYTFNVSSNFCHAPSILEIAQNHFFLVFYSGTAEGAKDVQIFAQMNRDGNWTIPLPIARASGYATWDPVLFNASPSNKTLLFYRVGNNVSSWRGYRKSSNDGGLTWNDDGEIKGDFLGPSKNKPILVDNRYLFSGSSRENDDHWEAVMELSLDRGDSWVNKSKILPAHGNVSLIQPVPFVTTNCTVRCLLRSDDGEIHMSESQDIGRTWTPSRPINLMCGQSGFDLIRAKIAQQHFLLLVHNRAPTRENLAVSISEDDGDTWRNVLTLESQSGASFAYPSVIQSSSKQFHIAYVCNFNTVKHVVLQYFSH